MLSLTIPLPPQQHGRATRRLSPFPVEGAAAIDVASTVVPLAHRANYTGKVPLNIIEDPAGQLVRFQRAAEASE